MKNLKEVLKDSRGFCCHGQTDLMIVVCIIGILAAIAIPKLAQVLKRSQADKPAVVQPAERAR